jgi:tetratricopeptide (TPR) repeat protein
LEREADEAWILLSLGALAVDKRYFQEALEHYVRAQQLFESVGETKGVGYVQGSLGQVYFARGDYAQAIDYYRRATRLCEEAGDVYGTVVGHNNLGDVYRVIKDWPNAVAHLERGAALCRDSGEPPEVLATVLGNLAEVYLETDDLDRAVVLGDESFKIANEVEDKTQMGITCRILADAWASKHDAGKASAYFNEAIRHLTEVGPADELAKAYERFARLLLRVDHLSPAQECFMNAHQIYHITGAVDQAARLQDAMRDAASRKGESP